MKLTDKGIEALKSEIKRYIERACPKKTGKFKHMVRAKESC